MFTKIYASTLSVCGASGDQNWRLLITLGQCETSFFGLLGAGIILILNVTDLAEITIGMSSIRTEECVQMIFVIRFLPETGKKWRQTVNFTIELALFTYLLKK